MSRTHAARICAYWLAECLADGWPQSSLDWLEALWWRYHDAHGNFRKPKAEAADAAKEKT